VKKVKKTQYQQQKVKLKNANINNKRSNFKMAGNKVQSTICSIYLQQQMCAFAWPPPRGFSDDDLGKRVVEVLDLAAECPHLCQALDDAWTEWA
jgi:hypothetical protein